MNQFQPAPHASATPRYESAKGCLTLLGMLAVLATIAVGTILLFSDPAAPTEPSRAPMTETTPAP